MAKSGAKLIGVAVLMIVVGVVLGYQADNVGGSLKDNFIRASITLCIGGGAAFLYGVFKLIAGAFKRS